MMFIILGLVIFVAGIGFAILGSLSRWREALYGGVVLLVIGLVIFFASLILTPAI